MGNINSFEDILLFLRRFWLLILAVGIVGTLATIYYALQQPHTWETLAVVRVEAPAIAADQDASNSARLSSVRLQQIEQDLLSRDAALEMIAKHRLFMDLPNLSLNEKIALMRLSVQFLPSRPEGVPFGPEQPITSVLIFSRQADPDTAAAVANDLAEQMVALSSKRQNSELQANFDFFLREEQRIAAEIAAIERQITDFKNANIDALPEGLQSRRDAAARLNDDIRALNREISVLDQELSVLRGRSSPRAVELRQIDALTAQIATLSANRDTLAAQRDDIELRNSRSPLIETSLNAFARQQQVLNEQLGAVIRRRADAETTQRLSANAQTERFELLETALPPEIPMQSKRRKLAVMGLVGSFGLGTVLAFLLDMRNPALRTSKQFERATSIRPVIAIPALGAPPGANTKGWRQARIILGVLASVALAVGAGLWALGRSGMVKAVQWGQQRKQARAAR